LAELLIVELIVVALALCFTSNSKLESLNKTTHFSVLI